jgi:hypothetical protein
MRERYWYVVTGLTHGQDDVYVTVSRQHGLQPTLEKAKAELEAVLREVERDAEDNDYAFTHDFNQDHTQLTIELANYNWEIWKIHKVKRN